MLAKHAPLSMLNRLLPKMQTIITKYIQTPTPYMCYFTVVRANAAPTVEIVIPIEQHAYRIGLN